MGVRSGHYWVTGLVAVRIWILFKTARIPGMHCDDFQEIQPWTTSQSLESEPFWQFASTIISSGMSHFELHARGRKTPDQLFHGCVSQNK